MRAFVMSGQGVTVDTIELLLLLAAAIVFAAAALKVAFKKVDLLALGLLLWVMVPLLHAADALS